MSQLGKPTEQLVTPEIVRDIDSEVGRVFVPCGVQFTLGQVREREIPGDRSVNGKLTRQACIRIAAELSVVAEEILERRNAVGES